MLASMNASTKKKAQTTNSSKDNLPLPAATLLSTIGSFMGEKPLKETKANVKREENKDKPVSGRVYAEPTIIDLEQYKLLICQCPGITRTQEVDMVFSSDRLVVIKESCGFNAYTCTWSNSNISSNIYIMCTREVSPDGNVDLISPSIKKMRASSKLV
jgi:hypothetical protein